MKKLLVLLFSILISFNSYGEVELDFSLDTFCNESPKVQIRNNLYYLPNNEKPYSGENICVYLSNGQYYSQGKIKNGLAEDTWSFWHENGQISKEENWKDGQITSIKYFKDDQEIGGSTIFTYYENGQKKEEFSWRKGGNLEGKTTYWYENGQKKLEGNYKDDKADGNWTWWYENGQIYIEGNYKNGKQDGKWTEWDENGQIAAEAIYKDGECISGDC